MEPEETKHEQEPLSSSPNVQYEPYWIQCLQISGKLIFAPTFVFLIFLTEYFLLESYDQFVMTTPRGQVIFWSCAAVAGFCAILTAILFLKPNSPSKEVPTHRSLVFIFVLLSVVATAFIIPPTMLFQDQFESESEAILDPESGSVGLPVFLATESFLEMQKNGRGFVVIDTRNQGYSAGHIPGAFSLPWQQCTEDYPAEGGELKPVEELEEIVGGLGLPSPHLNMSHAILIYALWSQPGGWGEEGRMYWMLKYLGFHNVSILYGGMWAWQTEDGDLELMENRRTENLPITAAPQYQIRIYIDEVSAAIDDDSFAIIDARSSSEYNRGHIPSAKLFHYRDAFQDDGNLYSKEDLISLLKSRELGHIVECSDEANQAGITETIVYCQAGVRAGFLYATLEWLGNTNTRLYAGSYLEWSNKGMQIETSSRK